MHIAYLCNDRGVPVGGTKGASIHVRGVVQGLQARGHRVDVLAARRQGSAATVEDVGYDRTLKGVARSIARRGEDAELAGETYKLLLNSPALRSLAALHRRRPIDAVYERYSLFSYSGMWFAREHGIPWILEVNAPLVTEQQTYRRLSLLPVARGLEGYLLRAADALVVPAAELRTYARRAGRRGPIKVVPNGVDLDLFERPRGGPSAEVRSRLADRYVIAFLGSLKPWHGVKPLLRAFRTLRRSVRRAHLLIIGEGPLSETVRASASRLGPEAITLSGAIPHERVPGWLSHASVGVAPYPPLDDFYFSPLKVVEYLAAGLPVVASDIGQIPRLVQHGRTGLLVPPGDVPALAAALGRLHAEPKLRARMGRRAAQRARSRHGWSGVAEKIETALLSCRERSRRRRPTPSARAAG